MAPAAALDDSVIAKLLVGNMVAYSTEKADRLVAKQTYRRGMHMMRAAVAQAQKAEKRARRLTVQEQAERKEERTKLMGLRDEQMRLRDEAASQLSAAVAKHSTAIALRCDFSMDRASARECREQLEAVQQLVGSHARRAARSELEHDKACHALMQTGFDRDKRCLLYTSPSPRDRTRSRMPSSA